LIDSLLEQNPKVFFFLFLKLFSSLWTIFFLSSSSQLFHKKRLGSQGASEVKAHPFFEGIDWKKILQSDPPFVPDAKLGEVLLLLFWHNWSTPLTYLILGGNVFRFQRFEH